VAVYFIDSSALVKRYVSGAGTTFVTNITDPATDHYLYVARITTRPGRRDAPKPAAVHGRRSNAPQFHPQEPACPHAGVRWMPASRRPDEHRSPG